MSQLPAAVRIREVGPRDGFQNEPQLIPTTEKVRLIELLAHTGRRMEVASFREARRGPEIETGVDLERLLEASSALEDVVGRPLGSHTFAAGPIDWRR